MVSLPNFIKNIFSGLSNINLASYAGSTRIIQVIAGIVLLTLSGKLSSTTSSLDSLSSSVDSSSLDVSSSIISSILNSTSSSFLSLEGIQGTNAVGIAVSVLTIVSNSVFSLIPYLFTREGNTMISSTVREDSVGIWSSLQSSEIYYTWGISGSELTSVALWGTSAIYSASKYGNWDCSDPMQLIRQYNSTFNDGTLSIFNGVLELSDLNPDLFDNTTQSFLSDISQIYDLFNSTVDLSLFNVSSATDRQTLLLTLSKDCTTKKAAVAMSFIGFFLFLSSAVMVIISAVKLRSLAGTVTYDYESSYFVVKSVSGEKLTGDYTPDEGVQLSKEFSLNVSYSKSDSTYSGDFNIVRIDKSFYLNTTMSFAVLSAGDAGLIQSTAHLKTSYDNIASSFSGASTTLYEIWETVNTGERVKSLHCSLPKEGNEDVKMTVKDIDSQIQMAKVGLKVDELTRPKSSLNCQTMKSEGYVEGSVQARRLKEDIKGTLTDNSSWSKSSQRVFKGFIIISELRECDSTFRIKLTVNIEKVDRPTTKSNETSISMAFFQDQRNALVNLRAKTLYQDSSEVKYQGLLDDVEKQDHRKITVMYSRAILFPERISI